MGLSEQKYNADQVTEIGELPGGLYQPVGGELGAIHCTSVCYYVSDVLLDIFDLSQMQYSDYEEEEEEEEEEREEGVRFGPRYRAPGEGGHLHLKEIFFSNQEYYGKLEELKRAHLRTMAELENMYRRKLQLSGLAPAPRDPRGARDPHPRDPSLLSRCTLPSVM